MSRYKTTEQHGCIVASRDEDEDEAYNKIRPCRAEACHPGQCPGGVGVIVETEEQEEAEEAMEEVLEEEVEELEEETEEEQEEAKEEASFSLSGNEMEVGIAVGVIVALMTIWVACCSCLRGKKNRRSTARDTSSTGGGKFRDDPEEGGGLELSASAMPYRDV
jgi:hypothetical protein